jgi:hypothetical protein
MQDALSRMAVAVAASDSDRAERIVDGLPQTREVLSRVAGAVAASDPDRAERIAIRVPDEELKAKTLAELARIRLQLS